MKTAEKDVKDVRRMTPAERKARRKAVFNRVIERNGDAITKLSKN